jgi:hypothetical protein
VVTAPRLLMSRIRSICVRRRSRRRKSDRFVVGTDHFEGHLSSRDDSSERDDWMDIRFGYRTLGNGDLAIAVFRPDLYEKSLGRSAES